MIVEGPLTTEPNGRWSVLGQVVLASQEIAVLSPEPRRRIWLHGKVGFGKGAYFFFWKNTSDGGSFPLSLRAGQVIRIEI
jgi:hypothetical protein